MSRTFPTYDELRAGTERPWLNPNGFVYLYLGPLAPGSRKLHVWPDQPVPPRLPATPIHDHMFGFHSSVYLGTLHHRVWEVDEDPEGDTQIFAVRPWKVVKDDQSPFYLTTEKRFKPRETEMFIGRSGFRYTFPAYRFHESWANGLTSTIITFTELHPDTDPRVLCPYGQTPNSTFKRDCMPLEFLWAQIEKVCQAVHSK